MESTATASGASAALHTGSPQRVPHYLFATPQGKIRTLLRNLDSSKAPSTWRATSAALETIDSCFATDDREWTTWMRASPWVNDIRWIKITASESVVSAPYNELREAMRTMRDALKKYNEGMIRKNALALGRAREELRSEWERFRSAMETTSSASS